MTLMTTLTLVLVYAGAAVVLFMIFAGIPMWMIRRHPDTAPGSNLPGYLRAAWADLLAQDPGSADRGPRTRSD
jgi:hypothetical protein